MPRWWTACLPDAFSGERLGLLASFSGQDGFSIYIVDAFTSSASGEGQKHPDEKASAQGAYVIAPPPHSCCLIILALIPIPFHTVLFP